MAKENNMAGSRKIVIEVYKCPCRKYFPKISRSQKGVRALGHMKILYCPICKHMRNMIKIG
jgi:hypothetical protein